MVIDSSAVLAILFDEPEAEIFEKAIVHSAVRLLSAANLLECAIAATGRLGDAAGQELDRFLERAAIQVEPVTRDHVEIGRHAFLRYGKGKHPAGLNFGDCFAYALAIAKAEPLLFKGDDFSKTDVGSALDEG